MSKDQKLVKIKRDTKSLVMKNLIVMAVLIIIALTGVISWFTNKTEATADGINVICEAPKGLKIAVVQHGDPAPDVNDETQWSEGEITLTKEDYPFLKEQSIIEITSDGTDFYKPKLTQENGKAKPDTSSEWDVADKDSYLSIDVYMKTGEDHMVYLNSGTEISPISTTLTGEQSGNKSDDGDFSKDCIVGAVRLSTVNSADSKLKNLWIPAPQIHYDSDKKEVTLGNTSGDTFKHKYWKVTKNSDGKTGKPTGTAPVEYKDVITNTNNDFKLGKNYDFAMLTKKQPSDKYASGMTTVNIWVDGEDDEARFAMVGGKFKATIKLSL
jgi:translation elongation factor P/translation initiation factor 5A